MNLFASVWHLDRKAVRVLKIDSPYGLHKAVYSLFNDIRSTSEKASSVPSGFLYTDQGGDYQTRKILLLSNREPKLHSDQQLGEVQTKEISAEFLSYESYRFKVVINPTRRESATRKLMPVKGRELIAQWFTERAVNSWGFHVLPTTLQIDSINVLNFEDKAKRKITLAQAHVQGVLKVTNREQFIQSFNQGIGRGRAFGCGLLQLVPLVHSPFDSFR